MAEIKCPCGLRNHMEEEDCKKTNCNACCPLTKPQTNADRIRTMSDEELAEFLSKDLKEPCDCCQLAVFEGACTETLCDDAMIKWLQQPSKGE